MKDLLLQHSKDFANKIINLTKELDLVHEYCISNQVKRSATSIAANLSEAKYAQSVLDMISKLEIALKECNETNTWLDLLFMQELLDDQKYKTLVNQCIKIKILLIKSIKTLKTKKST